MSEILLEGHILKMDGASVKVCWIGWHCEVDKQVNEWDPWIQYIRWVKGD
jgi:hypothetical protein